MTHFAHDKNEYVLQEDGLHFTRADGKTISLPWSGMRALKKSAFSKKLKVTGRNTSIPLHFLSDSAQKELALALFAQWRNHDPDGAKKAAFDYVDKQRGFTSFLLGSCLLFAFPLAFVLMHESLDEYHCSQALRGNSVITTANITKMTRKNDGPFLLELEFQTKEGIILKGKDQYILGENGKTPPTQIPLVYDRDHPSCWSLTPNPESQEVNCAKRRFFEAYTFLFGLFFALIGLYGMIWGVAKLVEKRDFREELITSFGLELK